MDRFDIPDHLRFEDTPGGLTRAVISTPLADAELYLQGAHVTRWDPRGQQPILFVSSASAFAPGKAIRGGIPIIYPWFGARSDGKAGPAHGTARSSAWIVESTRLSSTGTVDMVLSFPAAEFPGARARFSFGSELRLELEVRNDSPDPFRFEEAFHTYFFVADIHTASVTGLEEVTFIDKTDGQTRKLQPAEPVRCTAETDRVYLNTSSACVIHDPGLNRRILVEKTGSRSTVVWNPWREKTSGLSDMRADEWERMLCVETGNAADNAVTLAPGASHTLTATIRLA